MLCSLLLSSVLFLGSPGLATPLATPPAATATADAFRIQDPRPDQAQTNSAPLQDLRELTQRLAPKYLRGGADPDPQAIRPVLIELIDGEHEGRDAVFSEELLVEAFERLWPNLRDIDADFLVEGLVGGQLAHPQVARDLLEAAPYSASGQALVRFALSEDVPGHERIPAIGRILEAEGRAGLAKLRPLLRADASAGILRRIYMYWGQMIEQEDLPLLESLVREGPGLCREFALQTWARVETRPQKRLEIFRLSESSDSSFRSAVVRSLATVGPSPELSEHLRSMLDAPRSEERRLAMDVLPFFAGPEVLLEEWRAHRHPNDSLATQGLWMKRMARLSLPEARKEAARWLVDGGWQENRVGLAIARALGSSSEIDEYLSSFLRREEVPEALRLQLASDRARASESAAEYLRSALPTANSLHAVRICQVLAALGSTRDINTLFEAASDPGRRSMVRAAAVRALARCSSSDPESSTGIAATTAITDLMEHARLDYETAEALATTVVLQLDPQLRQSGLLAIAEGFGSIQGEELQGIQRAAWIAQAQRPRPEEAAQLTTLVEQRMQAVEDPYAGLAWPKPRRLLGLYPGLSALAPALAASSPGTLAAVLLKTATPNPAAALFVSAVAASSIDARSSLEVFATLASRPDLAPEARFRCLGRVARTAKEAKAQGAELAALEHILKILGDPEQEASLLELGWGLGTSSARGWLLPEDEIWQRLILAQARNQPLSGKSAILRDLLSGGCQIENLIEAASMLLEEAQLATGLAQRLAAEDAAELALRAVSFEPGRAHLRFLTAQALELQGKIDQASLQYGHARRLAPPGTDLAKWSRDRMEMLKDSADSED